eukprot:1931851-Rhodomonas_salina.4
MAFRTERQDVVVPPLGDRERYDGVVGVTKRAFLHKHSLTVEYGGGCAVLEAQFRVAVGGVEPRHQSVQPGV